MGSVDPFLGMVSILATSLVGVVILKTPVIGHLVMMIWFSQGDYQYNLVMMMGFSQGVYYGIYIITYMFIR